MSIVSRAMRDPPLLGEELEGAHVVEAVGELHQDDADVVHHGQEHLAVVLGLPLLGGGERILLILVTPSTMWSTSAPK